MNHFLKILANNFSQIMMNNFLIIGLRPLHPLLLTKKRARRTRDKTSTRSTASKPTRGQREAAPSTRTDVAAEADPEAPQPWTEEEIDLLRSLKINTKAKHAWSVIATRLSRTVEDCKTQWALHK